MNADEVGKRLKNGLIFGLTQYSEEFIAKIINYRMKMDVGLNRYLSYEEIAEKEKCDANDVRDILQRTAIIWNH